MTTETTPEARRITVIALLIVLLLSALDQTVVATAMPRIVAELKGLELYAWTSTIYLRHHYTVDVLASMLLLALGAGLAFNPLLLAAMGDVPPEQSGLASGLVNTTQMMGGALGLAILVSIAASRTGDGSDIGDLAAGYHAAFLVGACFALLALVLTAVFMHAKLPAMGAHGEAPADTGIAAEPH